MKKLFLVILLIFGVLIVSDAQTKKKANTKGKAKTNTKTVTTKKPEVKKKVEEIKMPPVNIISREELERQRQTALREIELTTELLSETEADAAYSLNRLNLLMQQLTARKKLVSLLEQEVSAIDLKIKSINKEIEDLEKDFGKIKENYARSMQSQQQEHRTAQYKMLLILSAEDLSQSYRRMRYLKEYSGWQKDEANKIISKQIEINNRKADLEKKRTEKQSFMKQSAEEGRKIAEEEALQQKEVSELNRRQKDLQNELQRKRRNAEALDDQIERLISEDTDFGKNRPVVASEKPTERAPETTTEVAEKKPESTTRTEREPAKTASKNNYSMTASDLNLSKDFASNKGRLPYPMAGSHTIVSSFGEHQHRELSYVRTNNNGIDIQTMAGTDARAIFKGVVTRVFVMPGFNYNVIIRHGDYRTVYSNISQVYVKAGDIVETRQAIGKIYTDVDKGHATILHFQIWKERTKLNPTAWIR
ncbi:MAG: peptidoglycan DD-metalloendopeptidase family protein [Tannerella sp.]|jgi:septal ring factor EnvC (AmiA/AmiB activator)|nr:peptidoglycan DD-metalloendopeptidase family protein [Tannerella sp.]